jgi:hypothetical protein
LRQGTREPFDSFVEALTPHVQKAREQNRIAPAVASAFQQRGLPPDGLAEGTLANVGLGVSSISFSELLFTRRGLCVRNCPGRDWLLQLFTVLLFIRVRYTNCKVP